MISPAEFTAEWEGFSEKPYVDDKRGTSAIEYSIGYGSQLLYDAKTGDVVPVTKDTPPIDEATALAQLTAHYARTVLPAVAETIDPKVWTSLSPGQRVAVQDTIYNVGVGSWSRSSARKALNKKDFDGFFREAFGEKGWVRSKGKVLPGLVDRTISRAKVWGVPGEVLADYWSPKYRNDIAKIYDVDLPNQPLSRKNDTGTRAITRDPDSGALKPSTSSDSPSGGAGEDTIEPVVETPVEAPSAEEVPETPEATKENGPFSEEAGRTFFRNFGLNAEYTDNDTANFAAGGPVDNRSDNMNNPDNHTPDKALPPNLRTENQADDVPARLTEGEFVMPTVVVAHFGKDKLYKMIEQARAAEAERHQAQRKQGAPAAPAPAQRPAPREAARAPGFAVGGSVSHTSAAGDQSQLIAKLVGALTKNAPGYAAGGSVGGRATTRLINPATGGSYYANVDEAGNPIKRQDAPSAGGLGKSGPYKMYPEVKLEDGAGGDGTEDTGNVAPGQFTAADIGQLQAALGGANWGNLRPENIWQAVVGRGKNEQGMDTYDFTTIDPNAGKVATGDDTLSGIDAANEYADDIMNNTKGTVGEQVEHDLTKDGEGEGTKQPRRGMPTGQVFKHIAPAPYRAEGNKYDPKTGLPDGMSKQQYLGWLMNQFSAIDESN